MNSKKGFTLIELLVVIAIIGILSSVVLASLNTARDRGSDAAIKASLTNAKAQAELHYDSTKSYANVCGTSNNGIGTLVAYATSTGTGVGACTGAQTTWKAYAQLKSSTSYFCVDYTGAATTTSSEPTGTACQ